MLCVCYKQGMLTEGKSVSGKKKRDTPWRKNINEKFATVRKQPPGLRRPGVVLPLHFMQKSKPRGNIAFKEKHFCAAFAVLNNNGPESQRNPQAMLQTRLMK